MKKIVIVGGGVSGKKLAESMSEKSGAQVCLIEPKEYFEVPFAQLRALVEPEVFSPKIRKLYTELLPGVELIHKKAVGFTDKAVQLDDGIKVKFDHLVIAAGAKSIHWPYLGSEEADISKRQQEVEIAGAELAVSSSVLIIGGGSVGVELAGEIAYRWPEKNVTIIQGRGRILMGLRGRMQRRAEKLLTDMGVKIQVNIALKKQVDGRWIDQQGNAYDADVIYPAIGNKIESKWMGDNSPIAISDRGAVKVDEYLRAEGFKNIFAIGDVNDVPEMKIGAFAVKQADLTAKNLMGILKKNEKDLLAYKPNKPMSFLPIGKKKGAVQLLFGHLHFLIALKQKDLFASKYLK